MTESRTASFEPLAAQIAAYEAQAAEHERAAERLRAHAAGIREAIRLLEAQIAPPPETDKEENHDA